MNVAAPSDEPVGWETPFGNGFPSSPGINVRTLSSELLMFVLVLKPLVRCGSLFGFAEYRPPAVRSTIGSLIWYGGPGRGPKLFWGIGHEVRDTPLTPANVRPPL